MLDLEGTKNERAVVIGLSYIIGFSSAFIWLAFSSSEVVPEQARSVEVSVAPDAKKPSAQVPIKRHSVSGVTATYDSGFLRLLHNDRNLMLSAASSNLTPEEVPSIQSSTGQGVHEDITSFVLNTDGSLLFFCENHGDTTCNGYVYDIGADLIRPVRENGRVEAFPIEVAKDARWDQGRLVVGDFSSVAPDQPWIVTRQ